MDLSYQDKGEYFRGLLILIGKDEIINNSERDKLVEIGQKFGFDKSFLNDAVDDFLENQFINLEAPQFSKHWIAEKFLDDAIQLSFIDNDFHTEELEWLEKVASNNGISNELLDQKIKNHILKFDSSKNKISEKNSV